MSGLTPSQTIGPFFAEALRWATDTPPAAPLPGEILVTGRVLDGHGDPVGDALLEIWQPGTRAGLLPGLQRAATDDAGRFGFLMPAGDPALAAHVTVFARGLLAGLHTRVYLSESAVPDAVPAARRATLVAQADTAPGRYRWDLRLSGAGETVFFSL